MCGLTVKCARDVKTLRLQQNTCLLNKLQAINATKLPDGAPHVSKLKNCEAVTSIGALDCI